MHTILVVEDEPDIADLVGFNLERVGMRVLKIHDGLAAVETAIRECADLVVLDLMLPGKDGFAVLRDLRHDPRSRDIPVLMLTAKAQTGDRIQGLEAGADDYLTKPFSPKELVLRVQAILRRAETGPGVVEYNHGPFRFDKNNQRFYLDGNPVDLTSTEFKLLLFLAERPGLAQDRNDLLRSVWGYSDVVHSRTLDTHMKRLRQKLGDHASLVETVRGVGYRVAKTPELMDTCAIVTVIAAALGLTIMALYQKRLRQDFHAESEACRKRHEEELHQLRLQRDRLLNALGDAFMIVDHDRRIRFANTAAHDLFRGRELVGRTVMDAFLDQRLAVALTRCLETGEPVRQQVILPQQASPRGPEENRGENAWMIDAAPIDGAPGEDRETLAVIRDVTAEHQTEQIRKDFVANASHELRTPLAIINGYLENLIEDRILDDSQLSLRFLKVMRKHSTRISRIIEDMLVISRLESGEAAALRVKPFPFQGCIHDVLERLESVIREQQAIVHVEMPAPDLQVQGDRFYFTQVLFNLVENALKQNPRPGLKIQIGCVRDDDIVRIWVSDDGVGIPGADLAHIFRRFYRVEKHHSQEEIPGTGLGLSIVKRAVEAHHGSIDVKSTPGRETRFTIELPATGAIAG